MSVVMHNIIHVMHINWTKSAALEEEEGFTSGTRMWDRHRSVHNVICVGGDWKLGITGESGRIINRSYRRKAEISGTLINSTGACTW